MKPNPTKPISHAEGAYRLMIIVVENEQDDSSSNPIQGCLYFTLRKQTCERYSSH